ncbi:MAG: 30S ribosomal protein S6 [Candidatus Doudnabacteria bacterium RIFCSPHIGHO2_02_FULL_46_11]|uniref:Small ribosomal subunit protein bS6 n=1 Tax=Candidatus Doudnabacteria bacterium RIFCSPHIGHO2_02_FULL_46_11 TaxID=1817832 RepID=A0A1F5P8L9_9BACT|nr:MAG: 30S ribosomal protein S6 [Candidatus Doudnabacteria bacterium RIFCSPHIGHO2_02_FULL_46_11]
MPKYEVGYILSSAVADDEVTKATSEISKAIESSGGKILNEDHWGRKKLAYPIGRTRNGFYVFITADLAAKNVAEVEHKLRTFDSVIRFMIVSMEEADRRRAKDENIRATSGRRQEAAAAEGAVRAEVKDEVLDQRIEDAISGEKENV